MTAPGWHPDPYRRHELRWWDGAVWSEHVSDQGQAGVDPVGSAPVAAVDSGWLPPTAQQPTASPSTDWSSAAVPPTVQQPAVPPGSPVPAPDGSRRSSPVPWIVGGVVVALLAAGGALLAVRGGSDDGSEEGTTVPIAPTSLVPETTGPLVLPTTSTPPATSEPVATTTPLTTTPPTLPAGVPPTGDLLVTALPTAADVPSDWVAAEVGTAVDFEGGSGLGQGLCGGDGESLRAWNGGSIGNAFSDYFDLPSTASVSYWLVGFPDEATATAYLAATAAQAETCAETINYELTEGTEPGQYDGFAEGFGDTAIWTFDETAASGVATVDGADEALELAYVSNYATTFDGTEFGGSLAALRLYERYGSVILVTELFGEWDLRGFSDTDLPDYRPAAEDLVIASDAVRPAVLDRLRAAGVIG
jgi:hypothetical protein